MSYLFFSGLHLYNSKPLLGFELFTFYKIQFFKLEFLTFLILLFFFKYSALADNN